jgi:hypothetical protein
VPSVSSVKPPANRVAGKFTRSQDIRRVFAKDVRAHQRNELISLLGRKTPKVQEEQKSEDGKKQPVLIQYISGPMKLQTRYKGKLIKASVRKNGEIRLGGKTYKSPQWQAQWHAKENPVMGGDFGNMNGHRVIGLA